MVTAINSRLLVFYAQMHRQTNAENVLWDQLHGCYLTWEQLVRISGQK